MLTQEQIQRYEQDGFIVVKQLLTLDECQKLKAAANRLINDWEPEEDYSWMLPTGTNKEKSKGRFMLDSSENVSIFVEDAAIDPQTGKLNRDKHLSVGKIGHGLHILEPEFKAVTFSDKIKGIVRDLKFIKPAIRQSLYIYKQPSIGAKVTPHQDRMYAYNDPFKIVGIWIALEDATIENSCLWFIPGSHSKPTKRRLIRNPNEQEFNEGKVLIFTGEEDQYDDSAFVPVEVKAGDAVVFHGQAVHKSGQNESPASRQIFAIHLLEMHNATYSKENWLQTTAPFQLLYGE